MSQRQPTPPGVPGRAPRKHDVERSSSSLPRKRQDGVERGRTEVVRESPRSRTPSVVASELVKAKSLNTLCKSDDWTMITYVLKEKAYESMRADWNAIKLWSSSGRKGEIPDVGPVKTIQEKLLDKKIRPRMQLDRANLGDFLSDVIKCTELNGKLQTGNITNTQQPQGQQQVQAAINPLALQRSARESLAPRQDRQGTSPQSGPSSNKNARQKKRKQTTAPPPEHVNKTDIAAWIAIKNHLRSWQSSSNKEDSATRKAMHDAWRQTGPWFKQRVSGVPDGLPEIQSIREIYAGLNIGELGSRLPSEVKKARFELVGKVIHMLETHYNEACQCNRS